MKRFISAAVAVLLLFSLASCNSVKGDVYTNQYADSKGNIVSQLEFHYPDTKKLDKEERAVLDGFFDTQKDDAENLMELNTDSVAYTLGILGSEGPQTTLINNETVYEKDSVYSCLIYTRKGISDVESATPTIEAATVDLVTGSRLSITELAVSDKATAASVISDKLTEIAKTGYYDDGVQLDVQRLETFASLFDEHCFYFDGENLVFPYAKSLITGDESGDIYYCTLPLSQVSGIIMSPSDYVASQTAQQ